MGRERKPQTGATNFSATVSASALIDASSITSSARGVKSLTILKPLTHKLISHPGEDGGPPSPNKSAAKDPLTWKKKQIDQLATWRVSSMHKDLYQTELSAEYIDPTLKHGKNDEGPFKEAEPDHVIQERRAAAVKKLSEVAAARFGDTVNMMKAFKKRSGDSISYYEFNENLRKRAMDNDFTEADLDLVFEQFDKKNEGLVPVDTLLNRTTKIANVDKEHLEEMMQIRQFLADQLKHHKKEVKDLSTSSSVSTIQSDLKSSSQLLSGGRKKPPQNDKDLVKKAIGQKTFDLDVDTNDLNEVIDSVFHKHHTIESHNKFSRFLRLTNVSIDRIPFYPMRQDELDRLKAAAARLESTCADKSFVARYTEVNDRCQARMDQSAVLGPTADKPAALNNLASIGSSIVTGDHEREDINYEANSPSGRRNAPRSPATPSLRRSESPTGQPIYFMNKTESIPRDFMKDISPTKAMQNKGSGIFDYNIYQPSESFESHGSLSKSMSDLSRIGMSMGEHADSGFLDRQMSTSSMYFCPLKYESSKDIARDFIGDATRDLSKREERRKKRFVRTEMNRQATRDRLEFEDMHQTLKELRTAQFRNEDTIRYQTAIFLNDMKCFKKQPLELMAKKPNFRIADKMWGGQQRANDVKEGRDFATTYKSDFSESSAGCKMLGSNSHHGH